MPGSKPKAPRTLGEDRPTVSACVRSTSRSPRIPSPASSDSPGGGLRECRLHPGYQTQQSCVGVTGLGLSLVPLPGGRTGSGSEGQAHTWLASLLTGLTGRPPPSP